MEPILIGTVDRTVLVFIPDPASTDGSGKTGLVAADLTVSYTRVETDNDVVVTDVTSSLSDLSALTDAHADWGLKEVSSTLAPGLYRIDLADAVFASGAWESVVYVMITASAAAATPKKFILTDPSIAQLGVNVVQLNGQAASAQNLERSASVIYRGTVGAGPTATTLVDAGLTQADTDHWKGRIVIFTSGALAFQATNITAFTPGTDTLTFTALTNAPAENDTYVIL